MPCSVDEVISTLFISTLALSNSIALFPVLSMLIVSMMTFIGALVASDVDR